MLAHDPDDGFVDATDPGATTAGAAGPSPVPTTDDDPLLDLLGRWEDRYRSGEDPTPEALYGPGHPLLERLRTLILRRRRLYALMGLERTPAEGGGEPPPSFPGHEILGEIGRGGMGVVYKARDLTLGRIVAIKVMIGGQYASAEQRERFRSEAQAAARLRHPNIIAIDAVGVHEGRPYLRLEYAGGGSLAHRLAEKPMAPREAAGLLETLAGAVHAAHEAGVVHRDLKPSNVLLTADGLPKIGDFGLAKLLDAGSERTASDQVIGSPSYMSPEQASGHSKRVGPAADVYALGAILYHALTGRPPFLGDSAMETVRMVSSTEVVPLRRIRPDVPRDLETICLKCLEKEPPRRYAGARALGEDLRRYLEGRPIAARPVGPIGRSWRWGRRNPGMAGLASTLLLTFALGSPALLALWLRARTDRDRAEAEASISRAVTEFVQQDMLAQASAFNQLTSHKRPDPDLKVRTALDRAAEKIGDRFANKPLVEASIRQTVGETYYQLGLYAQALPHLQRALDLRMSLLGRDDPDTLLAMCALGLVYMEDGKFTQAEPLLVRAMEGLRTARGPDHPDAVDAMSVLAGLYYFQRKPAEAERLLIRAREARLAARGADDPKTLETTSSLGLVYLEQGKPELAERTLSDVLARMKQTLGADHPLTLTAKHNLSEVYDRRGRSDEAIQLLIEATDVQSKVLGRGHPSTLASMVKLGCLYAARGRLDEAEALLTEALARCRTTFDPDHEATDAALAGLSVVYVGRKDLERLGPVLLEAARIARLRWGATDGITQQANSSAAVFLMLRREYARAEPYLRDCLASYLKKDPGDKQRCGYEVLLGVCLLAQERFDEASRQLLVAYNAMRPDRADTPPLEKADLGWLIERLSRLCDEEGRPYGDTALVALRRDPRLQNIVLDLQFPAEPLAPPEAAPKSDGGGGER